MTNRSVPFFFFITPRKHVQHIVGYMVSSNYTFGSLKVLTNFHTKKIDISVNYIWSRTTQFTTVWGWWSGTWVGSTLIWVVHHLDLPGGAATCSKGFVVHFLKVPLACWGSSVAAVQPNSLGNSQKTFYKTSQNKWPPHLVEFPAPTLDG